DFGSRIGRTPMTLIPHRFLFRVAYPCRYVKDMPREDDDYLLDLPEACRLDNFAGIDEKRNFADMRVAWNECRLGLHVRVTGRDQPHQGAAARPGGSAGMPIWTETRDGRSSHRASRYCHQFHLLAAGGGPDQDEPVFAQSKINRALQDAPMVSAQA